MKVRTIFMIPNVPAIKNPERFEAFDLPREKLETALAEVLKKVDYMMECFDIDEFPSEASKGQVYLRSAHSANGWGAGFYPGILWHAYELTGDEKYKERALALVPGFYKRIDEQINVAHHDMGFLFIPSCVAAYKLAGDEQAKEAALMAAKHLCTRYHESGKFIQAWGKVGDPNAYRLIVDCLLNIPLLYWAAEVTGDKKFEEIAYNHFKTTVEVCCREDASTFHTFYFDMETGLPKKGVTKQGANDDSAWSRGQGWGIYGPMLTYIYKKDEKALQTFEATTNFYLNNLPEDYIPYWDLIFKDGDGEPKDSSAAAIALCGILEGIKHMDKDDPLRAVYVSACNHTMNSLIDGYLTKDIPEANGLLLHAVYYKAGNAGVDEMNIWGCYFFMEALHRMLDPDWKLYW